MYNITAKDVEDFLNEYKKDFKKKLKQNNKDVESFKVIEYKTNYGHSEFRILTNRDIKIKATLIKFVLAIEHFNSVYEESGDYYDEDIATASTFWAAFLVQKHPEIKEEILQTIDDQKDRMWQTEQNKIFDLEQQANLLRLELTRKVNYYELMRAVVEKGIDGAKDINT